MPVITAAIDPITRIEGHLKVEVKIDTLNGVQQVVEAYAQGTLFRGFEKLIEGRDPRDATLITSRICGVCPTSHSLTAAMALENAFGVGGRQPGADHLALDAQLGARGLLHRVGHPAFLPVVAAGFHSRAPDGALAAGLGCGPAL